MNYFYITGTSRGIGKATAEELLKDNNNFVFGISRHNSIKHKNYKHISLDLSDLEKVKAFQFSNFEDAQKIVLFNNAGILGEVRPVGSLDNEKIIQSHNINLISPAILMNNFLSFYKESEAEKIIINTSSGAARHTIPSWSTYCSTKAGLEMFARVIADEQQDAKITPAKVFSVAPGVVDTEMQDEIREVEPENFRELERFVKLKKNGQLTKPEDVGKQYADIMLHPEKYPEMLMDLRE
ncbi:MAG: SDR family NAD(P)-dependent oxidoreductase [Bacteroidota bacterium]